MSTDVGWQATLLDDPEMMVVSVAVTRAAMAELGEEGEGEAEAGAEGAAEASAAEAEAPEGDAADEPSE